MAKVYAAFYYDPSGPRDKCYHWANADSPEKALALLEENAPLPDSWELKYIDGLDEGDFLMQVVPRPEMNGLHAILRDDAILHGIEEPDPPYFQGASPFWRAYVEPVADDSSSTP